MAFSTVLAIPPVHARLQGNLDDPQGCRQGHAHRHREAGGDRPSGDEAANLSPRVNKESINIALKPGSCEAKGFAVARNLGLVDALEVFLFKLKPETVYNVYVGGQRTPAASFKTNPAGMANGTAIGPMREAVSSLSSRKPAASTILVMEGDTPVDPLKAALASAL